MVSRLTGWYDETGNENDVVLFTRADLARNISGFLFPPTMNKEDSLEIINLVYNFFDSLEDSAFYKKMRFDSIDPLAAKLLEERGVVFSKTPDTPIKSLILHDSGSIYAGINLEDHLNMTSFISGLSPEAAYSPIKELYQKMTGMFFAAAEDIGFITSDIMQIGSGLKLTALCSLPGILNLNKLRIIAETANSAGLNILGYYTPNSKTSIGAIFSISTSCSAGNNEQTQIEEFNLAIQKIITEERNARKEFAEKNKIQMQDMLSRAVAVSQSAKLMEFKEAADIIFKIKLGLNLGLIAGITNEQCNAMLFKSQMGHIAFLLLNDVDFAKKSSKINESSIEESRALLIQEVCSNVRII